MNQRHTELAFQYIKESDAIIYLTYYNHPFSIADQQFIEQLKRTKDTFTLNKNFFIVNAIDLAKNEVERQEVTDYVSNRLAQFQLQNRLFALSSKKEQDQQTDEFQEFRDQFSYFLEHDVSSLLVNTGLQDITSIIHLMKEKISLQTLSEKERKETIDKWSIHYKRLVQKMDGVDSQVSYLAVTQEIEQLLHYVEKRLSMKISDFFKECYHPGQFVNQQESMLDCLLSCFEQFVNLMEVEIFNELSITTVRIENYIKKVIYSHIPSSDHVHLEDLLIEEKYVHVNLQEWLTFDPNKIHAPYKSVKQFIEKERKEQLLEYFQVKLSETFERMAKEYLLDWTKYYQEAYNNALQQVKKDYAEQTTNYLDQLTSTINEKDLTVYQKVVENLEEIKRQLAQ
ncbi:dynamin family protein [Bacillus carboniphilus]|uniref:Dynamin family protein n=1 Tax=Bacillus carboniphilus TaxID=86663 RepID=A0ABY9JY44_9BACI|nr:dynamin family protein [Bacillus carboniphilus]WLR43688.1 dynamin family protein [Bacillus carboniphilus]